VDPSNLRGWQCSGRSWVIVNVPLLEPVGMPRSIRYEHNDAYRIARYWRIGKDGSCNEARWWCLSTQLSPGSNHIVDGSHLCDAWLSRLHCRAFACILPHQPTRVLHMLVMCHMIVWRGHIRNSTLRSMAVRRSVVLYARCQPALGWIAYSPRRGRHRSTCHMCDM
jgi:hypothetical protein